MILSACVAKKITRYINNRHLNSPEENAVIASIIFPKIYGEMPFKRTPIPITIINPQTGNCFPLKNLLYTCASILSINPPFLPVFPDRTLLFPLLFLICQVFSHPLTV